MRAAIVTAMLAGCTASIPIDETKLVRGPVEWEHAAEAACGEFWPDADYGYPCPDVFWYGPDSMDCDDGRGFLLPSVDEKCRAGVQGANGILLAMPRADTRPSETALAHETAHWFSGDADHSEGALWRRVDNLNVRLADAGL